MMQSLNSGGGQSKAGGSSKQSSSKSFLSREQQYKYLFCSRYILCTVIYR